MPLRDAGQIVAFNNGRIGPGMPEIAYNPMLKHASELADLGAPATTSVEVYQRRIRSRGGARCSAPFSGVKKIRASGLRCDSSCLGNARG